MHSLNYQCSGIWHTNHATYSEQPSRMYSTFSCSSMPKDINLGTKIASGLHCDSLKRMRFYVCSEHNKQFRVALVLLPFNIQCINPYAEYKSYNYIIIIMYKYIIYSYKQYLNKILAGTLTMLMMISCLILQRSVAHLSV